MRTTQCPATTISPSPMAAKEGWYRSTAQGRGKLTASIIFWKWCKIYAQPYPYSYSSNTDVIHPSRDWYRPIPRVPRLPHPRWS